MNDFYDFKVQGLDGSTDILAPLRGKVKSKSKIFSGMNTSMNPSQRARDAAHFRSQWSGSAFR